jgi:membrane protease YdiL (CAAX protease family)
MKNNHLKKYALFILAMLLFLSFVYSEIPSSDKLITVVASYAFIIGTALLIGLDFKSVGLSKSSIKNGVKLALPFMLLIIAGAFILFVINPELFKDSRYQLSRQSMLYLIFISLPIFTVIFEELAFRGVLFGTLLHITSTKYAVVISSLAFGLWHIFTANSINLDALSGGVFVSKSIIIFGVVLATSFAGALFTWLRIKSDSLIAPMLVHWTINATGILLAYFAWLS